MLKIMWNGLRRVGAVALVASLGLQVWDRIDPDAPAVSPSRKDVANGLAPEIAEDIRTSRGGVRSAALLPLVDDDSGYVTDRLRAALDESGVLILRDRSTWGNVKAAVGFGPDARRELASALRAGKALGVDGVVFGAVEVFESYPGGARIEVDLSLADVAAEKVVFRKRYAKEIAADGAGEAGGTGGPGWGGVLKRVLGWALAVLLLPVFTISFVRAMARRESNMASLVTVLLYTGADAALAWIVFCAALSWPWALVVLVVTSTGAFFWNAYVMRLGMTLEGQA